MTDSRTVLNAATVLGQYGFGDLAGRVIDAGNAIAGLEAAQSGVDGPYHPKGSTPGERIRDARRVRCLTTDELAARMGVSKATVGSHERGLRGLNRDAAEAYAKALNVSPASIVFG